MIERPEQPAPDPGAVADALGLLGELVAKLGPLAAIATEHLTVDDCAGELKCSRDTIVRLIETGRLPAKDLGHGKHHNYRIRRADLERLTVEPPAKSPARRRRRAPAPYPRLA